MGRFIQSLLRVPPLAAGPGAGLPLLALLAGFGCSGAVGDGRDPGSPAEGPGDPPAPGATGGGRGAEAPPAPRTPAPGATIPGPGGLRRLTASQYWNTIDDLLGPGLPRSPLDPDLSNGGSTAVGAARVSTSATGVELYEAAAFDLARKTFSDPARRAAVVGCAPASPTDDACARSFLGRFGRLAFRRPLSEAELGRYLAVAVEAGRATGDGFRGLEHAVAAILQSPKFVYRLEAGGGTGTRRKLTGYEVASRLAFLVTDAAPDAALLDAAGRGELATPAGVGKAAERLLAGPRARAGLRAFFAEWLGIGELPSLGNEALAAAMREESMLLVDEVASGRVADLAELFTSPVTFLNRDLARHYGLPAPAGAGFVKTPLPSDGPRAGFLGHAAFLAASSSKDHTSPTLRGKFVREALLCQEIPPPPPGVATTLPEPPKDRPVTTRQRLEAHRADPSCAGCHALIDPIGLAFEPFDWQGRHRATELGLPIDPRGELDGEAFPDARGLGARLARRPELAACAVRTLFRAAVGHVETPGEGPALERLVAAFQRDGRRFGPLVARLVTDETFLEISTPDAGGAR
jgi:hypothetical protein